MCLYAQVGRSEFVEGEFAIRKARGKECDFHSDFDVCLLCSLCSKVYFDSAMLFFKNFVKWKKILLSSYAVSFFVKKKYDLFASI